MSNKMWGGRFGSGPGEIMKQINESISFDQRLYQQDITGSKAHCAMLAATGIISKDDSIQIIKGLDQVLAEIEAGDFTFSTDLEDIHMNVEARLTEILGAVAGRLHTARSRNDQVATDFKLYVREACDHIDGQLQELQLALAKKGKEYADAVMPGFTHLQTAQPVTFGHHMMAYVEMFARDRSRFADARKRMNESPLGAAALAGTSFPIDRYMTAKELGFDRPTANSLDSVSDRDFALEALSAATISGIHLSRLAEEIVIWCSAGFKFISLTDAYTTGSSIMPQKRNPDAAELVRAKAGRVAASFTGLVMVMKGLPLAYSKDMQEDKEATFDALDNYSLMLAAMSGMVDDMTPDTVKLEQAAGQGFSTATDIADWCVRVVGMPFRDAHHVTGQIVALAEQQDKMLHELTLEQMQQVESAITKDIFTVLSVQSSSDSRTSYGGTSPTNVKKMAQNWIKQLESEGLSA